MRKFVVTDRLNNQCKIYLIKRQIDPALFCDRLLLDETTFSDDLPTAFVRSVVVFELLMRNYSECDPYMLYLLSVSLSNKFKEVFAAQGITEEVISNDLGISFGCCSLPRILQGISNERWVVNGNNISFIYCNGDTYTYQPQQGKFSNIFVKALPTTTPDAKPKIPSPTSTEMREIQHKEQKKDQPLDVMTCCDDLTELARNGKLDPLIGREAEMTELIETLLRRKKGNPLLIGEPGAGKSALVEGLAQKIVSGAIPAGLGGKRLLSLNLTALMSGTMYRGQLEQRIEAVVSHIEKCKDIILFIDEMHGLVSQGESLSLANMLKPALANGRLQIIGATTLAEFRKYIEKDGAFARRFSKIIVRQPTAKETVKILQKLKPIYEACHNVKYSQEALENIVSYAERYLPAKQFPDKAIDIMDMSGIKAAQNKMYCVPKSYAPVNNRDIANALSAQCGIPAHVILGYDNIANELQRIRTALTSAVIGQSEAIERILDHLSRAKLGLLPSDRPQGSFLFAGPTGVGKSFIAKILAGELYSHDEAFIKLDMSEYMEKHTIARLIGAPPGYLGHDEAGQLSEKLRKNPYALVLVDEIDKAHIDVLNLFLQILEDGYFTDSIGYKIDCRHATFIFTTNAGAEEFGKQSSIGFGGDSDRREDVRGLLSGYFRPEFLNRVDVIVGFSGFSEASLMRIFDLELNKLQTRYSKHKFTINVTEETKREILKTANTDANGARELRRIVEQRVAEAATAALIRGENSVTI